MKLMASVIIIVVAKNEIMIVLVILWRLRSQVSQVRSSLVQKTKFSVWYHTLVQMTATFEVIMQMTPLFTILSAVPDQATTNNYIARSSPSSGSCSGHHS